MHRGIKQSSEQISVSGFSYTFLRLVPSTICSLASQKQRKTTPPPCAPEVLSKATNVGFSDNYSGAELASLFLGPVGQQICGLTRGENATKKREQLDRFRGSHGGV